MKHAAATVFARLPGLPGLPSLHGVLPARLVLWMAAALCGCQAMSADAPARVATPAPSLIHTITLERGCFGCADAGLLVLRRDGVATHTMAGNARQGTVDKTVQGRITAGDFNKLAGLLVAQGFFALDDSYEDPQIRDGAWVTLGVTLGVAGNAPGKQVFSREGAGPAALKSMASAVEAARVHINFTP